MPLLCPLLRRSVSPVCQAVESTPLECKLWPTEFRHDSRPEWQEPPPTAAKQDINTEEARWEGGVARCVALSMSGPRGILGTRSCEHPQSRAMTNGAGAACDEHRSRGNRSA
eukprot:8084073-Pyramimonas_sp.AAC.1